jgi:hypothetical protein
MPNWCETRCNVTGPEADLQKFRNRAFRFIDEHGSRVEMPGQLVFDYGAFVPMPPEIEKLLNVDNLTHDNWIEQNWGSTTKCYGFEVIILEDNPLEFTFLAAWSFPKRLFETIAKQYPSLVFHCTCAEPGMVFGGDGYFNAAPPFEFCDLTDEIARKVWGCTLEEMFEE